MRVDDESVVESFDQALELIVGNSTDFRPTVVRTGDRDIEEIEGDQAVTVDLALTELLQQSLVVNRSRRDLSNVFNLIVTEFQ
jgi:hypothetical protein